MDRDLPQNIVNLAKFKTVTKFAIAIIVLLSALIAFRSVISPSVKRSHILTAVAEIGDIEATLTASGLVIPEFEQVITSPIPSKIDSVFVRAGEKIERGVKILELNKESIQLAFEKLLDEYELKKNKKSQLKLDLEKVLINLLAEYDIKKLGIQFYESKLELEKQLQEIDAGTKESLDQAKLNLEISRRELEKLRNQIENHKKSLKADLRELDLQIGIQEKSIKELERQMNLSDARAEMTGVVTWINENIGSSVNVGDVIAKVADLSSFKVEARISDLHSEKLIIGSPVKILVNDEYLYGIIFSIRPTIENGIVSFMVQLDEKDYAGLKSNLRVDVFAITDTRKDIVRVSNGAFINGSGLQDIFVIEGGKAFRKSVRVGAVDYEYVELMNDIAPGEEIIISDMTKYRHQNELKVR